MAAQRLQGLLLFVELTAAAAGAARLREVLSARAPAINAWLQTHRNGPWKISLVERQTSFLWALFSSFKADFLWFQWKVLQIFQWTGVSKYPSQAQQNCASLLSLAGFFAASNYFPQIGCCCIRECRGFLQEAVILWQWGPGEWFSHQSLQANTVCSWSLPVALTLCFQH